MIRIRRAADGPIEELELEEFERLVREGRIAPQVEVCFPAVTGARFVPARELELFHGLYDAAPINFRHYFNLARFPWVTLVTMVAMVAAYLFWQRGAPDTSDALVRQGAKSPALMVELGQWWRLAAANFLHVSPWHLAVNVFFLLNLGGPTEAIYRRLDYVLILGAAGSSTFLVSAALNPAVSCGASGMVFGVWGAAAVFGVRHRSMLPDRYRRYFIGGVVPYSIFTLYLGFAMPGVDNWGHLGGLIGGCVVALLVPARLLAPPDRLVPLKLGALALVALLLAAGRLLPFGVGELSEHRFYSRAGLVVPVPEAWPTLLTRRERRHELYAFGNGADVGLGVHVKKLDAPVRIDELAQRFVAGELADELELAGAEGLRISDPVEVTRFGLPARRLRVEVATKASLSHTDYYLIARGYYRYAISLTAPRWLGGAYDTVFEDILAGVGFIEPEELASARRERAAQDSPMSHTTLGLALAYAGDAEGARRTLEEAQRRWPDAPEPAQALARLLHDRGDAPREACRAIDAAVAHARPTPALVAFAVDVWRACGEGERADLVLTRALADFPDSPELDARRREPATP